MKGGDPYGILSLLADTLDSMRTGLAQEEFSQEENYNFRLKMVRIIKELGEMDRELFP